MPTRIELVNRFAAWISDVRFHPAIVAARIDESWRQATGALSEATRIRLDDPAASTHQPRESARALRLVLIEQWGERLGSMGREWTRFARPADRHGQAELAARIAVVAGADPTTAVTHLGRDRAPHG
ncbi:hypothetical protein [Krasilnikovia cinnamomea]|uniref:hypothetical protein n=1 Tax=Krasilnikovia cinnamomea TaxID=349313 RepID=UPI00102C7DE0|nr:hypothetical protein [Krasilnikovia cinnamomea]